MKETLLMYLREQRNAVLWKVDGLPERELRMPRTPTGTNLLGVVKHLAGVEVEYFGACLGREWPDPWWDDATPDEPNADMWATADETPEQIIQRYRGVIAWADEGIAGLELDAPARVPWWREPETTLHRLLVHMTAETARHAGHLDILREQADGQRGLLTQIPNLPDVDEDWWRAYVERLRAVAERS
ncbi:DinB family protein [Dactylosporangium sp. AC04546]|uniref:DinB family protein n=1 Tax=Dactylosporangium sp. AC04546 TaxID=2862460 RepID=UPI001EE0F579|nr:DinB family protein [Dactylosporangium sp. AC04546]WVK79942.1 DinB family protein [Dactylosporangium sp. AC04546]